MRIVAGSLGGRVLRAPRGANTRPTSEKVREALFNVLGPPPDSLHVLDLFAGSGALGIEALSRGARGATFVERAAPALAALRDNLDQLGVRDRSQVLPVDVARFLQAPPPGPAWAWIFMDPPYADGAAAALAALPRSRVTDDAVVVVEHAHRAPPPDAAGFLVRTSVRRYGDTALSLYRIRVEEPHVPR